MRWRGVSYDVGRVMGMNWRPDYDPAIARRELSIIRDDLHCNAIRICGLDLGRLMRTTEDALDLGLEVWLSPERWNRPPERTREYVVDVAAAAERLRERWPDRLVLCVGSELTLFMQGILPGRSFMKRLRGPSMGEAILAGRHNPPLNAFLSTVTTEVRRVFHGPLTYASLIWEAVDWGLFDLVGVDHYRDARIEDRYVEMLRPHLETGKPVVITEFGFPACQRSPDAGAIGAGWVDSVDHRTQFFHQVPLLGRLVHPRLTRLVTRDERLQAELLTETLGILDGAGVDGAFVFTFVNPLNPFDDDPRHDLDRVSPSLVKTYERRHGTTYPDMTWEPKEAFRAVAAFYAGQSNAVDQDSKG